MGRVVCARERKRKSEWKCARERQREDEGKMRFGRKFGAVLVFAAPNEESALQRDEETGSRASRASGPKIDSPPPPSTAFKLLIIHRFHVYIRTNSRTHVHMSCMRVRMTYWPWRWIKRTPLKSRLARNSSVPTLLKSMFLGCDLDMDELT